MLLCEYLPGGNLKDWLYGNTSQSSWYALIVLPAAVDPPTVRSCVIKGSPAFCGICCDTSTFAILLSCDALLGLF